MTLKTTWGEIHIMMGWSLLVNGHGVGGSHWRCAPSMQRSLTFWKQAHGTSCPAGGGGVPRLPLSVSGRDVALLGRGMSLQSGLRARDAACSVVRGLPPTQADGKGGRPPSGAQGALALARKGLCYVFWNFASRFNSRCSLEMHHNGRVCTTEICKHNKSIFPFFPDEQGFSSYLKTLSGAVGPVDEHSPTQLRARRCWHSPEILGRVSPLLERHLLLDWTPCLRRVFFPAEDVRVSL